MKKSLITLGIAVLLLGLASSGWAHVGNRVFPIFELTDEDVAVLDVTDGFIDDWLDIIGEPTITALDLSDRSDEFDSPPYDPVDFDYRIWLAWHGATNRIYGAMQRADDHYMPTLFNEDWLTDAGLLFQDAPISFLVDGDHSAGVTLYNQTAQHYLALAMGGITLRVLGSG